MGTSSYEIHDGSILSGGQQYWLDIRSDPHNSIGWVRSSDHSTDDCDVASVIIAVPEAREYVIEATREAILKAFERAEENDYPQQPIRWLQQELDEAVAAL